MSPSYQRQYRSAVPAGGGGNQLHRYQAPKKKGASFIVSTEGKSFEKIKQECRNKKVLFQDPEFPADDNSLFFSKEPPRKFEWKRPHEICDDPQLFVGGASRFDIKQGMLGDCWLLAAIASLSLNDALIYRVIPQDQSFKKEDYAGIFHFQFWQYGEWIEVLVDDLLPTYNNRLIFLHSDENNEFWSALLEKAYAKLNGSYEALKGGQTSEAMEDFTGGVTETFELSKPPRNLFKLMLKSLKKGALMGCSIEAKPNEIEAKLDNGLVKGHAYSVTGVEKLQNGTQLVRIRNPWGQREWNGAWSDDSSSWKTVSPSERKKLALQFSEDGEFWMSLKDFTSFFTTLEICNLGPEALKEDETTTWVSALHLGHWTKHSTAGGCRNFPDTFWMNPQVRLTLEEEDDDPDDDEDGCSFIVALMQKGRRKQKRLGAQNLTIGFAIYKLEEAGSQPLQKEYFLYHRSTTRSKDFVNSREIVQRFLLPPGTYVIVPSTFKSNEEGDFVMRIFTEKRSGTEVMDIETKQDAKIANAPITDAESEEYERKFKPFFNEVAGEDGVVDAFELQGVLKAAMKTNIGIEACRSMVALMDITRSGTLDWDEFKNLFLRVRKFMNIFKQFDKDGSGTFDLHELRAALQHLGYSLSGRLYELLCIRYAGKDSTITMDDFVLLSIRLGAMFKAFNSYKEKFGKDATATLDNWLLTTVYT